MKISAVIVAGGKGKRMRADINKVFLKLCGREMILHTVDAFLKNKRIDEIIVVTNDTEQMKRLLGDDIKIVEGGGERQQSVYNGLMVVTGEIVLIHDGARALIAQKEIDAVIDDCIKYGAAALGVPCKDTLKSTEDGFINGTIDRAKTYLIQTPQAFCADTIKELHKRAKEENISVTDDCAIAERYGVKVKITEGSYDNLKLTTPEDMIIAEKIIGGRI